MSKKYLDDTGLSTLVSEILEHFQKKLTAGTNITIDANNVISTSGSGTDTGATSVGTTGSGNAFTSASYNASTRKITFTKGKTFLTSAIQASETGTNFIKYNDGLLICWGKPSNGYYGTANFPKAFASAPIVMCCMNPKSSINTYGNINAYSISTTSCNLRCGGTNSTDTSGQPIAYIAIGKWK